MEKEGFEEMVIVLGKLNLSFFKLFFLLNLFYFYKKINKI